MEGSQIRESKGIIPLFGVYLSLFSVGYYNKLSFDFEQRLGKHRKGEAEALLTEAAQECGYATFQGDVSFDNNGGFSSVRSLPVVHDLSAFEGLVLKVRGDGKRYGFRLRTDASFDGVSYQVEIVPPAGEWVEIAVPFGEFVPVYRGRLVQGHPELDPRRIATFGLLISRQEGAFRLDIEAIRAIRPSDTS